MKPALLDSFAATPLLDHEVSDILFAVETPAEQTELRSMLEELESDVGARLGDLVAQTATLSGLEAKRACHPLKGNTSSFGLARCAAVMAHLEHGWEATPVEQRALLLTHGRTWLTAGISALRARYPYLAAAAN
ncbi:MAG TPA: hypothetical protein VGD88_03065 [Opitutaceae bacterium]